MDEDGSDAIVSHGAEDDDDDDADGVVVDAYGCDDDVARLPSQFRRCRFHRCRVNGVTDSSWHDRRMNLAPAAVAADDDAVMESVRQSLQY